jgi:hypothetical protein
MRRLANSGEGSSVSMPTFRLSAFESSKPTRRQLYAIVTLSALAVTSFLVWPRLRGFLLATDFLPHLYCYMRNPGLVWTHVVADTLIGIAYLAIPVTLGYLVHKARRDIPFPWMLMAFGLFIVACGGTHFMEVVTIWIPVYVLSATVKIFTVVASLTTAVVLPFMVPRVLTMIQQEKISEPLNCVPARNARKLFCAKSIIASKTTWR